MSNSAASNPILHSPAEVYPQSKPKHVRKVIFATVFLFIIANVFFYFFIRRYDEESKIQEFAIIDQLEEPVDILIMGDSVTNSGINPHLIEEATGLRAINVSMNARWTFYHDVWITEYYIDKFGPPKYIIIGKVYDQVHRQFDAVSMLSSSSYPFGFTWQSDYLNPKLTQLNKLTIVARRLFPLYFRDQTIETIVRELVTGETLLTSYSRIVEQRGFSGKDFVNAEYVERDVRSVNFHERVLSDENKRVIEIFIDLVEKYNIPTYTFITPVPKVLGDNDRFEESIIPLQTYWFEQSLEHPILNFNPEVPEFGLQYFTNSDHLNSDGADLYTEYLIDWIWGDYTPQTFEQAITVD